MEEVLLTLIPPPEVPVTSNVQLPENLWERLDFVVLQENEIERARAEEEERKPIIMSRMKVIRHFLEWADEVYWTEKGAPDTKKFPVERAKWIAQKRAELLAGAEAQEEQDKKPERIRKRK